MVGWAAADGGGGGGGMALEDAPLCCTGAPAAACQRWPGTKAGAGASCAGVPGRALAASCVWRMRGTGADVWRKRGTKSVSEAALQEDRPRVSCANSSAPMRRDIRGPWMALDRLPSRAGCLRGLAEASTALGIDRLDRLRERAQDYQHTQKKCCRAT